MFAPDDISATLADTMRRHRERLGLTQAQVAKSARLRGVTIYQRLEYNQRSCSMPQLTAIATVFGVAPHELMRAAELGGIADPPNDPITIRPVTASRAVAAELRHCREQLNLTQAEVAARAGFRWATIYQRLEYHERRCSVPQLTAIANVFAMAPHELLYAAELRALAGDLPQRRTGLRQALNFDPDPE